MTIYSTPDNEVMYLILKFGMLHNKILSEEWINANFYLFPLWLTISMDALKIGLNLFKLIDADFIKEARSLRNTWFWTPIKSNESILKILSYKVSS